MDRRTFLAAALGAAASLPLQAFAGKSAYFHELMRRNGIQSRTLWLRRPQSDEIVLARYANGHAIERDGYFRICRVMRDIQANVVHPIDPRLLDILGVIQTWLALNNIKKPIDILSGYRTEATNQKIRNSARNSMHLKGKAADIRIRGVNNALIRKIFLLLEEGGVGIYKESNFIHVDTGKLRTWSDR